MRLDVSAQARTTLDQVVGLQLVAMENLLLRTPFAADGLGLLSQAHAFMATKVFGHVNLGVVLGFGQFVTTFGITILYVRFAGRTLDPRAAKIRSELEGAGE